MDVQLLKERARLIPKMPAKTKKQEKRQEMLKPRPVQQTATSITSQEEETEAAELDRYFPVSPEQEVTTYLFIPLAPTPTNRLPLRDNPSLHSSTHPLLPFSLLSSLHTDHATHTLRVSTMFARLDGSRVFDNPEVSCSAFGDPSGLCTILEVKFDGWSESRVRSVLGEAGMGWCVLEEVRHEDEEEERAAMDDYLAGMTTDQEDVESTRPTSPMIDPSASFVLPTLDFSASFPAQSNAWMSNTPIRPSTPLSDLAFHNEWSTIVRRGEASTLSDDGLSEVSSLSRTPSTSPPLSTSSSLGSDSWVGLGFSSQFAGRVERSEADWSEPREYVF